MLCWDNGKNREAVKTELKKDFDSLMDKVDLEDYDPASRAFMAPLSVGLLWHLVNEMEKAESKSMNSTQPMMSR